MSYCCWNCFLGHGICGPWINTVLHTLVPHCIHWYSDRLTLTFHFLKWIRWRHWYKDVNMQIALWNKTTFLFLTLKKLFLILLEIFIYWIYNNKSEFFLAKIHLIQNLIKTYFLLQLKVIMSLKSWFVCKAG